MRPNRLGAQGCPDSTSPGGGALQAVLSRSFSRHRAEARAKASVPRVSRRGTARGMLPSLVIGSLAGTMLHGSARCS